MNKRRIVTAIIGTALAAVTLVGCQSAANKHDQNLSKAILGQFEKSQPAPQFTYSQIRQTAIDIETAQAKTTQTTTFFFNQGVAKPVQSCPSIGFPIPSTAQITNPQQQVGSNGEGNLAQIDPNGIYQGDSSGTYVLCVNATGDTYGVYWEGFVYAVTGPAVWDNANGDVKMTGPSSFDFKTAR